MLNELDSEGIAAIERVLRQAQPNAQDETVAAFLASINAELRDRGLEWNGTNVVPAGDLGSPRKKRRFRIG